MLKSEEHSQQILVSQLNAEKRARRAAEKKAHDADLRVSDLTNRNMDLESRLETQLNKVSEMVQQITAMLMGGGVLSLPDSLKEELIGAMRVEFERQKQELKDMHEKEKQELIASFNAKLAAKDNEIARLKGEKGKTMVHLHQRLSLMVLLPSRRKSWPRGTSSLSSRRLISKSPPMASVLSLANIFMASNRRRMLMTWI